MNIRSLKESELKKTKILDDTGINYELLFLTDTGLKKHILDATAPIVKLLRDEKLHDYDSQSYGDEYKVILPCIILSKGVFEETKISLYCSTS